MTACNFKILCAAFRAIPGALGPSLLSKVGRPASTKMKMVAKRPVR